eukprot:1158418-Pelagomonas_calceolata.AAC.3
MCRKQPGIGRFQSSSRLRNACVKLHTKLHSVTCLALVPLFLQPSVACAKSATASVPSATPMCGQPRLSASAMSATTGLTRDAASSAGEQACLMPTIARNAHCKRKM